MHVDNFGCSGYLYLQVFFVLIFRLLHLSKPGTSTGVVSLLLLPLLHRSYQMPPGLQHDDSRDIELHCKMVGKFYINDNMPLSMGS